MRTKNLLLGFLFVVCSTVFLLIFGDRHHDLRNLVSQTRRHLNDNIRNIKDRLDGGGGEGRLEADDRYLSLVGLGSEYSEYIPRHSGNWSVPAVVTYARDDDDAHRTIGLARNVARVLPDHTLLIYNLGLSKNNLDMIEAQCNVSRCVLIEFDLDRFPSHVADAKLHAFRPLIIQDALRRAGGVLYLEPSRRLRAPSPRLRSLFLETRSNRQVTACLSSQGRPVTSLTHPHMFKYFRADADHFIFLPMVGVSPLLVFDSQPVHTGLMMPWVQCALTHDCILPIGAQSGGCRFDKKPGYRYSGCHSNDISALNIVLGLHFGFRPELYSLSTDEENRLFTEVTSGSGDGPESDTASSSPQLNTSDSVFVHPESR